MACSAESGGRGFAKVLGKNLFSVGSSSSSPETGSKDMETLLEGKMPGLPLETLVVTESYEKSLNGEGIRVPPWLVLRDISGP